MFYNSQKNTTDEDKEFAENLDFTKNFLREKNDLFFTTADNGNRTVCLRKSEYIENANTNLSDKSVYTQIKKNPLTKLQTDVAKTLKELNDSGFLSVKFHNNALTQMDKTLPLFYELPEIYKIDAPLRPIVSCANSPTYSEAKVLYDKLKNEIPTPDSHVNNSFEFKNKLKTFNIPKDYVLLSLDVSALFINVSCDLVIQSLDKLYQKVSNNCDVSYTDIIDYTFFKFEGKFYQQIHGTPMGSPISPLIVDICM